MLAGVKPYVSRGRVRVRLHPKTMNFQKNNNNFINWFNVMNDIYMCSAIKNNFKTEIKTEKHGEMCLFLG